MATRDRMVCITTVALSLVLSFAWPLTPAFAATQDQAGEATDLFQLSLDDLLSVKVYAATRSERSPDAVPGIVRVVHRSEWQRYGAETLTDVLRRLPGTYPYGNSLLRDGSTDLRGQQAPASDRHLLLLLNGRPVREAFRGAFDRALNVAFPLAALERIEFIRGAGSAVYGSNAFSGVINLITRETPADSDSASGDRDPVRTSRDIQLSASAGSHDSQRLLIDGRFGSADRYLHASLQGRRSDGWPFAATDLDGVYREDPAAEDDQSLFVHAGAAGFHLQTFVNDFDFEGFGNVPRWPLRSWTGDFALTNLGWSSEGTKTDVDTVGSERFHWQFNYTETRFDSVTEASPAIPVTAEFDSRMRTFELESAGNLNPSLQLVFGAEVNALDNTEVDTALASGSRTTTVSSDDWQRLYGQLDWSATASLNVLAGITANWTDTESGALTPRLGLVYQYGQGWLFKWHYGEAFRSPYLIERFLQSGSFVGNPMLDPETIRQHDVQLQYRAATWLTSLALFVADIDNLIAFAPTGTGGLTYRNVNTLTSRGGEWEWRWQPDDRWALESSISYQQNEDGYGVEDTQLVPNTQVKFGAHHRFDSGWAIALFDTWTSTPVSRTELNPATAVRNPIPQSYHHLTVNLTLPVASWFGLPDERLRAQLYLDNAVESDPIYLSDSVRADINSLPYRPGRRAFLQVSTHF